MKKYFLWKFVGEEKKSRARQVNRYNNWHIKKSTTKKKQNENKQKNVELLLTSIAAAVLNTTKNLFAITINNINGAFCIEINCVTSDIVFE